MTLLSLPLRAGGRRLMRWWALLALAVVLPVTGHAQIEVFLKFSPTNGAPVIPGDSTDPSFRGSDGWFVIRSFSIGATNGATIGSSSGGAGGGRLGFLDFAVDKAVNVASPLMFQALATGRHYGVATIVIRRPGERSEAFLTYEFKTVFFTAQYWSGASGDEVPGESLRMAYAAFRITYRPENPDGSLGAPVIGMWNQVNNTDTF